MKAEFFSHAMNSYAGEEIQLHAFLTLKINSNSNITLLRGSHGDAVG
jgi:hypothetical protein